MTRSSSRAASSACRRLGKKTIKDEDDTVKQSDFRPLTTLEKETLTKITDLLESEPERIFELWARLTSSETSPSSRRGADATHWNSTYCYWRQISKSWLANLCTELGRPFGLTKEVMENLDDADRETVWRMCTLFFGIRQEDLFPRPLLMKSVMQEWLIAVGDKLGARWEHFMEVGAITDEGVDWMKVCPYQFVFKDGKIIGVSHNILNKGNTEYGLVDGTMHFDESWTCCDVFDDRAAYVQKRMLKPRLREFFSEAQQNKLNTLFDPATRDALAKAIKERQTKSQETVDKLNEESLQKGHERQKAEKQAKAKDRRQPKAGLAVPIKIPAAKAAA